MKKFNTTGLCIPSKHYMVDISSKLSQIKTMIDEGLYFTINRGRQYGKTTTLNLLETTLKDQYIMISISFESLSEEDFASDQTFCQTFLRLVKRALKYSDAQEDYIDRWGNDSVAGFETLGLHLSELCQNKKIVLMIDEVDKTSNNRVYLHFLGMLRDKYLERERGRGATFQSVILAGVYDIKNIKLKLINEGLHTLTPQEGKLYNSPWNIAAKFNVEMSFSSYEIATMLAEYEADHALGMDIMQTAEKIFEYTGGYPFLVSNLCKIMDEERNRDFSQAGIQNAVKLMLREKNTLFDDLFKNLENSKELYDFTYRLLIVGESLKFSIDNPLIELGVMLAFFKDADGKTAISNRIFEIRMCEYFISKDETGGTNKRIQGVLQYDVVENGRFNMELCLRKFAEHYKEMFQANNAADAEFLERHGRMLFLSYLRPLINGQGFYHIESQLTDLRRMDIAVDFGRDQFIIELKLWKGESAHEKAYAQLAGYLAAKNADIGYLLTFDFRKNTSLLSEQYEETGCHWVETEGKHIFDIVISAGQHTGTRNGK